MEGVQKVRRNLKARELANDKSLVEGMWLKRNV